MTQWMPPIAPLRCVERATTTSPREAKPDESTMSDESSRNRYGGSVRLYTHSTGHRCGGSRARYLGPIMDLTTNILCDSPI